MKMLGKLTYAFPVLAGLGAGGCDEHKTPAPPAPPAQAHYYIDPLSVRPIGVMRAEAGGPHKCNYFMAGSNVAMVSTHCLDENRRQTLDLRNPDGTIRTARELSHGFPSAGLILSMDFPAGTKKDLLTEWLADDGDYMYIAKDKALVRIDATVDEQGILPLATLDAAVWRPVPGDPDIQQADVSLLSYWPDDRYKPGPYRFPCNAFRWRYTNEVIAHNCPFDGGVSSAPIVIGDKPGEFAAIALVQGGPGIARKTLLVPAFSRHTRQGGVVPTASTVHSVGRLCTALDNCAVQTLPGGRFTLRLTY